MALLLGLDFETTGVDPGTCLPLEFGCQTYDTLTRERGKPFSQFIWEKTYPAISQEITDITGITDKMVQSSGVHSDILLAMVDVPLKTADILVAYNASYDRQILFRLYDMLKLKRPHAPWFDPMMDLPWPARMQKCRKLQHRALDLGLSMDEREQHRAMADIATMFDIFDLYDMSAVLEYWRLPWVYLQAIVPPPWTDGGKGRDMAKAAGFGWEAAPGDEMRFPKKWVKRVKETDATEYLFKTLVLS